MVTFHYVIQVFIETLNSGSHSLHLNNHLFVRQAIVVDFRELLGDLQAYPLTYADRYCTCSMAPAARDVLLEWAAMPQTCWQDA